MSRLITFGCSYTYGDSLPDCTDPYNSDPSQYAWPTVLGKILKTSVINQSKSGAGNLEILWNILNFDFRDNDICIIMWSHFSRDHIFTPNGHFRVNQFDQPDKITKHWSLCHDDYDLSIRNWIYIDHANCCLSKLKNSFFILAGNPSDEELASRPRFVRTDNFLDLSFSNVDYGADGSHPGIKSHINMAREIYNKVKGSISHK